MLCHFHEALNIISYQFSSSGGTMLRVVTQHTALQTYRIYEQVLSHVVQTGLNFIIVDQQDRVCAILFGFDIKDQPSHNVDTEENDLSHLQATILSKSNLWKKYMHDPNAYKFGELICDGHVAVRPDKIRLKLGILCTELYTVLAIATGYRMIWAAVSHPVTMRAARTLAQFDYAEVEVHHFGDITLKNGKHIDYYYNKLREERGFSVERIERLREKSIWGLTITHCDRIKTQKYDPYDRALEEWVKRGKISFQQKTRSKL